MHIARLVTLTLCLVVITRFAAQSQSKVAPDTAHFNTLDKKSLFKQGEKFTMLTCGACHMGTDGKLSGKQIADAPKVVGKVYSANITNDPIAGIGKWSGAQLAYFITTGIDPDGRRANIMMPRFPNMADEQLRSIVAFTKSDSSFARSSSQNTRKSRLGVTGKVASSVKLKEYAFQVSSENKIDTTQLIPYGEYLVDDVLHCFACHSAGMAGVDLKEPKKTKGYHYLKSVPAVYNKKLARNDDLLR